MHRRSFLLLEANTAWCFVSVMNLALATSVARIEAAGQALEPLSPVVYGFVVDVPADVRVDITVKRRPLDEWRVERWKKPEVDVNAGVVELRRADWTGVFDCRSRHVAAVVDELSWMSFDSLLRWVVEVFTLHDRTGLVLHASAVESDGQAVLFLGRSGAGKSTAAALAAQAGASLLADDVIFVELAEDGQAYAHCLPLIQRNQGHQRPRVVPVVAMYSIAQGPRDAVSALDLSEQLRRTMIATTLSVRDPYFARVSFSLAEDLSRRVPVRRLEFRDSQDFWAAVCNDIGVLAVESVD